MSSTLFVLSVLGADIDRVEAALTTAWFKDDYLIGLSPKEGVKDWAGAIREMVAEYSALTDPFAYEYRHGKRKADFEKMLRLNPLDAAFHGSPVLVLGTVDSVINLAEGGPTKGIQRYRTVLRIKVERAVPGSVLPDSFIYVIMQSGEWTTAEGGREAFATSGEMDWLPFALGVRVLVGLSYKWWLAVTFNSPEQISRLDAARVPAPEFFHPQYLQLWREGMWNEASLMKAFEKFEKLRGLKQ